MSVCKQTGDWAVISNVLFDLDPMNTACRENGCVDEYHRVARGVADRLAGGQVIENALADELAEWFGEGLVSTRKLLPTVNRLKVELGAGGAS